MKLTLILMLAGLLQVSAKTTAAQTRISITLKGATLQRVFNEIEKRSGYTIFYNTEVLKAAGLVTVEAKDATVEDVMQQCLKGLPLEFTVQDKTIFVKREAHKTADADGGGGGPNKPTPSTMGGEVQEEETGAPLMGATVYLVKLKKMLTTDKDGQFSLKDVPDGEYEVMVSYIGYEGYSTKVKVINHEAWFTAKLKKTMSKLDESVVIAYGTTTERLNTGDVSKVTSKEIEEQPVSNVLEALEGRVPGLLITQTTGLPGGGFKVEIRGQNSIASGTDPFYVIDGVPYISQLPDNPLNGALNTGSPLNFINPQDIESIEVLKDADATAIYGSRAANGAILITTKKGKAGSLKVDLNFRSGFTNPARTIGVLNTPEYLTMRHEAFMNDGETPGTGDHDINGDWDTTRNDNWSKVFVNKPAQFTDAEGSVSGGNTNTQYLIGAGYIIQRTGFPTLLPGDGGDRKGSVHFNVNSFSPDKRFKIAITGSYVADKNTVQSGDFSNTALDLSPDAPAIFNAAGNLNWAPLAPGQTGTWTNPYAVLYDKYVSNTSNLIGNGVLSYALLKGLDLKTSFGYTYTQTDEVQTVPTTSFDPGEHITSGSSTFNVTNVHSWIIEPQVNYHVTLSKGTLTALAGGSFNESNSNAVVSYANGFVSDALLQDIQAASSVTINSSNAQYKYEAVFGRLGYNWMDKYLINFNARRDGTSRFGPGKQFGNFWAVGAGWIFTKENFFQKNFQFLSFGKLRGSYGTTGNDQVGDYQFVDLYSPTAVPYQGSQGIYPTSLYNPLLAWELTRKLEGGIELGFFKDRVMLQANIFRNRSGNELVQTPVSSVTGFQTVPTNLPALVQNTGQEYILSTINIKSKSFAWSSSFNISIVRNKLLAFPNLATSSYSNLLVIGQPLSVHKLYHSVGVNDTTGVYEFSTAKGGLTYSPNYLTNDDNVLLDLTPRFYGGFGNSFSYKGFSLNIFFQFVKQTGRKLWAANDLIPGTMYNEPAELLSRWQKPGDKKPYEMFTQNYGSAAAEAFSYALSSDFAYGDASFVRLKNLSFGWNMPGTWTKAVGIQNFKIYVQCQNLLTITKYDGLDPENQSPNSGPRRAYTAGVNIGL